MSRGDRREDIFLDDVDRQNFLKTLAEACQKTDWPAHAYCLMRNHFGGLRLAMAEGQAERILAEELERLGGREENPARRRKSEPEKLAMAARLRRETTLTIKRIAARMPLGASRSGNVRLHERLRDNPTNRVRSAKNNKMKTNNVMV